MVFLNPKSRSVVDFVPILVCALAGRCESQSLKESVQKHHLRPTESYIISGSISDAVGQAARKGRPRKGSVEGQAACLGEHHSQGNRRPSQSSGANTLHLFFFSLDFLYISA